MTCAYCSKPFTPKPNRWGKRQKYCKREHAIAQAKLNYELRKKKKSKIPTTAELVKRGLAIDDEYKKPGNLKFGKSKGGK